MQPDHAPPRAPPVLDLIDPFVTLVRWPHGESERRRLAAGARPRLLVIDGDHPPPPVWDELEDWVREPVDRHEVRARWAILIRRHRAGAPRAELGEDGLVRVGEAVAALTDGQRALAAVLLGRRGEPVGVAHLRLAYGGAGGSREGPALATALASLARRIAPLGLRMHTLRGGAVLLDAGASGSCSRRRLEMLQ